MEKRYNFPEKEPDPGKEIRLAEYIRLLKEGVPRGELPLYKRYEVTPEQQQWDCEDAEERYRSEMMAFGSKDLSVKAHIQERLEIGQKAKKNGELNIAMDAIKDIAKLQGLYEEKVKTDSKVEFVFRYEIPEENKVIDVVAQKEQITNGSSNI